MSPAPQKQRLMIMRALLVAVAVVLLLASGCSDSDDGDEEAAEPDPTATTSTGPATSSSTPEPTEATPTTTADSASSLQFSVEGVTGGSNVPVEFTCDGTNATPAVTIESVPAGVVELALIVDDPDAPTDAPFVHWVVYAIGPETATITDGDASQGYGVNDAGTEAWFGPCPPPGDGLHTYRWKLFGLSEPMNLEAGLDGRALEAAVADAVVAEALLIASYERAG